MLIIDMPMPKCCAECPLLVVGVCMAQEKMINCKTIEKSDKCPIKGELPESHGDLIDRYATAEELNQMADEVYEDFPLIDRETLASWDHGIRIAAQYVQNLAGRKDDADA